MVVGRLGPLVRHFEEEEIGELLDVVAVGKSVVSKDVAVRPELADQGLGIAHRGLEPDTG